MLVLKEGKALLPCDAILISGQCIVNESMLTGTAHPSQVYHQNIVIALWLQPVTGHTGLSCVILIMRYSSYPRRGFFRVFAIIKTEL